MMEKRMCYQTTPNTNLTVTTHFSLRYDTFFEMCIKSPHPLLFDVTSNVQHLPSKGYADLLFAYEYMPVTIPYFFHLLMNTLYLNIHITVSPLSLSLPPSSLSLSLFLSLYTSHSSSVPKQCVDSGCAFVLLSLSAVATGQWWLGGSLSPRAEAGTVNKSSISGAAWYRQLESSVSSPSPAHLSPPSPEREQHGYGRYCMYCRGSRPVTVCIAAARYPSLYVLPWLATYPYTL